MGTHPIFESDFDCLTEMYRIGLSVRTGVRSGGLRSLQWTVRLSNNEGAVPGDLDYRRPRGKIWNDEAEIPEYKVEWAPPKHPADVKREYLIEDKFQMNKWQDTFH